MPSKKIIAAAAMTAALGGGSLIGVTLGVPSVSGAQDTTTTAPDNAASSEQGRPDRGGRGGMHLEMAAETLGLTTDELKTELQAGKSLATIAEDQGVDKQELIDALVAAGEARLDEAMASLPDRVAEMVERTMPAGGPEGRGDHGPGEGRHGGRGLESAATALGVTTDELRTALQDGKGD